MRRDTVFFPSFGNRPTFLVGREEILRSVDQGLASVPGSRERATVLLGQRGSGKTVLLWEIADRARKQGMVVASPTIVDAGMLERIVEKIQDSGSALMSEQKTRISGVGVGALGFTAELEFSREVEETKSPQFKMTQLIRKLSAAGHGTLILIDELQANSDEVRKLVSVYQEMVGEGLDVAMVMAGLPAAVSAILNDHVLTFLNRAQKVSLPPLKTNEVEAFFRRSFEALDITLSQDNLSMAARQAQGSPYLMQLIGHDIVLESNGEGIVTDDAFERAIEQSRAMFMADVCETTLRALSEQDVFFLECMVVDEVMSKTSDVANRMGVTTDYAQKYRKRLMDAGIIESAGWGKVRFAVPHLAGYLAHKER